MKRENKNLCLISAISLISFIVGVAVSPFAMIVFFELISPNRQSQEREAKSFFYRTMNAIFEDTYNSEEGSVSPQFMNAFKKYEPQLGKKCRLYIIDSHSDYYECFAFFPSGDVFNLVIALENESWILYGFNPRDWDSFWENAIRMSSNLRLED
jgi:hypothetical protein